MTDVTAGAFKTLHTAYRVSDRTVSLEFYFRLGYREVGQVGAGTGESLTMLKLPGDEVVTLELVHRHVEGPVGPGGGFHHLVIQVNDLAATVKRLKDEGLRPTGEEWPAGALGPRTSSLTDPDGYRIELVQWPPGHPDGITAADFGGQ